MMDPTRGYVRGATDAISLDMSIYNGQPLPNAPLVPYYFNTPTGNQWNRPVVSLRWMPSEDYNSKDNIAQRFGAEFLLTLRDVDGNVVLDGIPLIRLAEVVTRSVPCRNIYFRPRRIDWRNSFIMTVQRSLFTTLYVSSVYQAN